VIVGGSTHIPYVKKRLERTFDGEKFVSPTLEDGIMRGRFRESLQYEKLIEPGVPYEFSIKLYPTSNVFKRGHRIRLDVSSSNFPRFDVNPNTGEPLNRHRRIVIATNTVYHERGRPSRVVLPVIPD
jgi:putative CocE/NonD family hydrolase